jgi:hypothetical protein
MSWYMYMTAKSRISFLYIFSDIHHIRLPKIKSVDLVLRWKKSENPVILSVIHHRQNPLES